MIEAVLVSATSHIVIALLYQHIDVNHEYSHARRLRYIIREEYYGFLAAATLVMLKIEHVMDEQDVCSS